MKNMKNPGPHKLTAMLLTVHTSSSSSLSSVPVVCTALPSLSNQWTNQLGCRCCYRVRGLSKKREYCTHSGWITCWRAAAAAAALSECSLQCTARYSLCWNVSLIHCSACISEQQSKPPVKPQRKDDSSSGAVSDGGFTTLSLPPQSNNHYPLAHVYRRWTDANELVAHFFSVPSTVAACLSGAKKGRLVDCQTLKMGEGKVWRVWQRQQQLCISGGSAIFQVISRPCCHPQWQFECEREGKQIEDRCIDDIEPSV